MAAKGSRRRGVLPVYFRELSLTNVRCFGPTQTLKLSEKMTAPKQWTIILGDNGVGKTTLLLSLAGGAPFEWNTGPDSVQERIVYVPLLSEEPHTKRNLIRSPGERAEFSWTIVVGGSLSGDARPHMEETYGYHTRADGKGGGDAVHVSPANLAVYCYGAGRRTMESTIRDIRQEGTPLDVFRDTHDLMNAEEWLIRLDYAASKDEKDGGLAAVNRERVVALLKAILPDLVDEGVQFLPPDAQGKGARIEFKTPYGWVGLSGLSLGYRTMVAWMVDLASRMFERYPESQDPLLEPAVVIIDEIDLHLHPQWQRRLISYISERFRNTQFIVSAHSPLIVQNAVDANIVLLRREGDHVVIDQSIESVNRWRIDQILTSRLYGLKSARSKQLDDLLEQRTKLLSKAKLTGREQASLRALEGKIGDLPTGETEEDRRAMDIIRRAAARLDRIET